MSHPCHNEEFTFLLQSCMCPGMTVLCYEWKSWWQAEKLKAILVKTTNKQVNRVSELKALEVLTPQSIV